MNSPTSTSSSFSMIEENIINIKITVLGRSLV